jgi:hypothetical protein
MKALVIQCLNSIWLVIIFIAIPSISSMRLGPFQITSRPTWHFLALCSVAIGVILNTFAYLRFARDLKERRTCTRWIYGHCLLGLVFWGSAENWLKFQWLKDLLLSLEP